MSAPSEPDEIKPRAPAVAPSQQTGSLPPEDVRAAAGQAEIARPKTVRPRAGLGAMMFWMMMLAIGNTFILGVLDVVAISGVVGNLGTENLPWLWVGEMTLALVISGGYIGMLDRFPRASLVRAAMGGLAVIYLVGAGLFALGVPSRFIFPVLYLVYSQQTLVFPIIYWNLANDIYTMAEARKMFPLLASGEMIGRLIGYSLFSLPSLLGHEEIGAFFDSSPSMLLVACALIFLLGLGQSIYLFETIKKVNLPRVKLSLLGNLREGLQIIREVALFRYLSMFYIFGWVGLTLLWFKLYIEIDRLNTSPGRFQTLYSIYGIASLVVPLLFQWLLTGFLSRRISPGKAYLMLPVVICLTSGAALLWPISETAIGAVFLSMVIYNAWDQPNFQTMQNLIPDQRRGRASAILGNYSYSFGTMLGAGVVLVTNALGLSARWTDAVMTGVALLCGLIMLAAALRLRDTYEDSLLSWKLARRQRSVSVLDKL